MARRVKKKLTAKQSAFVEEFLIDLNSTQAAIRAGYSPRSAHVTAARTLANAKVQAELAKAFRKRSRRTQITADNVLREYARIAFADITNVVKVTSQSVTVRNLDDLPADVTAAIAEVAQTKDGIRVKFHSKTQALESLARHLGLFNDRLRVDLRPDLSALPLEALEALEQVALERRQQKSLPAPE